MASSWNRYLRTYAAATLLALGGLATLNLIVDPLWVYHRPILQQRFITNERFQSPGLARHAQYDAVVIGNSHTQNFRPAQAQALFGWKLLRLSMSGASAREQALILQTALETGKVKQVLWGLDFEGFQGDPARLSMPENAFPHYLYRPGWETPARYLLSLDTLSYSLKALAGKGPRDLETLGTWDHANRFDESQALASWRLRTDLRFDPRKSLLTAPEPSNSVLERRSVNENLVTCLRDNPQVEFYCFFPPFSLLSSLWESEYEPELFQRRLIFNDYVAEQLLQEPNCRLYDFQQVEEITGDLNNYKDLEHYSGEVSRFMLAAICRDQWRVTLENHGELRSLEARTQRFREQTLSPGGELYGKLALPANVAARLPSPSVGRR